MTEWSRALGEETFHVLVDCHGGQIPKTGQGGGGACTAYLGGAESPFTGHLRENRITVIDLRPLRKYFSASFFSPELSRTIVSFDAYATIPNVEHSEPLNEVPRSE